jgi:nucleotide-binding universal stress UspA family protein
LRHLVSVAKAHERKRLEGPDLKYPAETRLVQGDAADEVLRVAEELGCGLIVMGTHGRTGLGRLLMGSVVEFVMPRAACPVLVVKSLQQAAVMSYDRQRAKWWQSIEFLASNSFRVVA